MQQQGGRMQLAGGSREQAGSKLKAAPCPHNGVGSRVLGACSMGPRRVTSSQTERILTTKNIPKSKFLSQTMTFSGKQADSWVKVIGLPTWCFARDST